MLLGRRNATTGGTGNNLASVSPFQFLSNDDGQCLQFSLKKDGPHIILIPRPTIFDFSVMLRA
jgi:hypothetical protein